MIASSGTKWTGEPPRNLSHWREEWSVRSPTSLDANWCFVFRSLTSCTWALNPSWHQRRQWWVSYGSCDIHPLIWLVRLLSSMVGGETPRPDLECFSEAGLAGGCVGCLERAPDISVNALVAAVWKLCTPNFDIFWRFTTIIALQSPIEIATWATIITTTQRRGHVRLRAKWRPQQTSAADMAGKLCFQPCHG